MTSYTTFFNHYDILDVSYQAIDFETRKQYLAKSRAKHFDKKIKNVAFQIIVIAAFQAISNAHDVLVNEEQRLAYDKKYKSQLLTYFERLAYENNSFEFRGSKRRDEKIESFYQFFSSSRFSSMREDNVNEYE